MTNVTHRLPTRRPSAQGLAAAFLILAAMACMFFAAACGKPSSDFGSDAPFVPDDTVVLDPGKPSDTLSFASLNMSIGFPVSQLLFTNMEDTAIAYTVLDSLYKRYQRGRPGERIKGRAKAISA